MVPVVLVSVHRRLEGEALYVDGLLMVQEARLDALTVLGALDCTLYNYGTASVTTDWFSCVGGDFPNHLADIPFHAFVLTEYNPPAPCEHCGSFHEDGSC